MPTSKYATSGALGVPLADVFTPDTSAVTYVDGLYPNLALGAHVLATDGSSWIQVVLGVGGITGDGYVCTYDTDFTAVMLSDTTELYGKAVGVPNCGAAVAGDYVWLQLTGSIEEVQVAASAGANKDLVPTATAGQLDDDVTTGLYVKGLVLTTSRAASNGTAPGYAAQPMVIDTLYEPET